MTAQLEEKILKIFEEKVKQSSWLMSRTAFSLLEDISKHYGEN